MRAYSRCNSLCGYLTTAFAHAGRFSRNAAAFRPTVAAFCCGAMPSCDSNPMIWLVVAVLAATLPCAGHHQLVLLLDALHRHEPHRRPLRRLADRRSQIAAASAASFFCRFTNGLT